MAHKIFYSPGEGGFYHSGVHERFPADVIEIPEQEWRALLEAQQQGKRIVPGGDGRPVAANQGLSVSERAAKLRRQRDRALSETDWLMQRHQEELLDIGILVRRATPTTLSIDQYSALLFWRAQLRDLPTQKGFPDIPLPDRPANLERP